MTFWKIAQIVCSIGGSFVLCLWLTIEILKRVDPWLKNKWKNRKNCLSCGFCKHDFNYYMHCTANANQDEIKSNSLALHKCKEIPDPKHMGGPQRCSKYITKRELQKRLTTAAINNFEYPKER